MKEKIILLVEDNPRDEALTLRALKKSGITNQIVVARDGAEALDYLFGTGAHSNRDTVEMPTVILLDLNLSYPDGLDVLHQVRKHEATRHAPVVLVAGGSLALSPEDAEIVHGLVHKPFDIDLMLNAVREALGDPVVEVQPRQYDAQDHFLHGY